MVSYAPHGIATNDSRLFDLQFDEWCRLATVPPGFEACQAPKQSPFFSITQLSIEQPRHIRLLEGVLARKSFHCSNSHVASQLRWIKEDVIESIDGAAVVVDCAPVLSFGNIQLQSHKFNFQRVLGRLEDKAHGAFVAMVWFCSLCALYWIRPWRVKIVTVIGFVITVMQAYLFCAYVVGLNAISGVGMLLALSHCPSCILHLATVYDEQLGAPDRLDWSMSLVIPGLCQSSVLVMVVMVPLFLSPWAFIVKHMLPAFFSCLIVILVNSVIVFPGMLAACNASLPGISLQARRQELERLMIWQKPDQHFVRMHYRAKSRMQLHAPMVEAIRSVKSSLSTQSRPKASVVGSAGALPSLLTEDIPKDGSGKVEV